jgi:endonuclease/exonuclease/phosphatase family metal-dependent hydrolase
MNESVRYELPIDESFVNKFFDLDRCINLVRYKVNASDKELVIISAHLSAYDEGGVYRKKQIELLKTLIQDEYDKGNYVIVGGDFNHDIASGGSNFPTTQLKPDWLQTLNENEFGPNFKIISDNTNPSCRDADIPWEEGVTYATVVDGFIVSNNIEVTFIKNIVNIGSEDINFMYSDHNPVMMKFKINN